MEQPIARNLQFSRSVIYLLLILFLTTIVLQNGIYWFLCLTVMLILIQMLWKPHIPGIFIFCMLYQWLQVFGTVVFATFLGKPLDFRTPHNDIAVIVSLVGLILIAMAIQAMVKRFPVPSIKELRGNARYISPRKVLMLYIIFYFISGLIQKKAFTVAGFTQILFAVYQLKWVFYMLYAHLMLLGVANKRHFVIIFLFEFLSGFYSYFSNFKDPLFYLLIVVITYVSTFDMKRFLRISLLGVVLAFMFIFWTHIKGSYREFLRGNTQSQAVTVSQSDAFDKLQQLLETGMSKEDFDFAVVNSIYRVEYTYHLSLAMDRVPSVLPHEYGGVMLGSLFFVITPRFLNPEKGQFDASAKTRKYTGINYAGVESGVSISLGYFTEAYVDFGYFGMFFPLILIGLFIGYIFLSICKEKGMNLLLGYSLASAVLIHFQAFETDSTIIFGRLLISFIIFKVLIKYFLPVLTDFLKE